MLQNGIPDKDVSIESRKCLTIIFARCAPVVIVSGTAIMFASVSQCAADTDHENRTELLANRILALFGTQIREAAAKLLSMYEMDFIRKDRLDGRILLTNHVFSPEKSGIDPADNILQKRRGALTFIHDPFPVPLVHIQGVDVVKLLIGPDSVHVRVDPVSRFYVIFGKGKALPLGEGVNYLTDSSFHVLDRETHRSFNAVEVVIYTGALFDEQGSGDTTEPEFRSQVHLEEILDLLDGPFGLTGMRSAACRTQGRARNRSR